MVCGMQAGRRRASYFSGLTSKHIPEVPFNDHKQNIGGGNKDTWAAQHLKPFIPSDSDVTFVDRPDDWQGGVGEIH